MKILSNKQINNAINCIAEDALKRAHEADKLSLGEFSDTSSHLADNSIELASIIGGLKGISKLNEIVERYRTFLSQKG